MKKEVNIEINSISPAPMVEVHLPSKVSIELVQGNELRNYEIFFLLAGLGASTATSFWTALILSPIFSGPLCGSSVAFTTMTGIFLWATLHYRSKLWSGSIKRSTSLDNFKGESLKRLPPPKR